MTVDNSAFDGPTTDDGTAPAVAAVIPAYNEAATIAAVAVGALKHVARVIVVDDGSTDGTQQALADFAGTVIRHPVNRGKAASLWDGMQAALAQGAEAVITLDGDGQHDPDDIPRLLAAAGADAGCLVIAARLNNRDAVPKARRFANAQADFWISWAAGVPIRDTQSGFRLYPARLIARIGARRARARSFVFESEILIDAARQGFRPLWIATEARYGTSTRASYYRPWADTLRIIAMVAGKLLRRGMSPLGLLRSQGLLR
jgi:glycosyltransferase involved in cell wall biosynthesis